MTCARRVVEPPRGSAVAAAVSVMVDPVGARRGTFSQPIARSEPKSRTAAGATAAQRGRKTDIMKALNILVPMHLRGQEKAAHGVPERESLRSRALSSTNAVEAPRGTEKGYAMADLLVAISIMAIMMTVAMPVWKQTSQREKEEELIFRGKQYARVVGLFGRKYANANPPTLDVLIDQHFLRKKYKDPITQGDFQMILAGQALPGSTTQSPAQGRVGAGQQPATPAGSAQRGQSSAGAPTAGATGGVIG